MQSTENPKRRILVELDNHEITTPSFYLDVFGFARDRETTLAVGRWVELPEPSDRQVDL